MSALSLHSVRLYLARRRPCGGTPCPTVITTALAECTRSVSSRCSIYRGHGPNIHVQYTIVQNKWTHWYILLLTGQGLLERMWILVKDICYLKLPTLKYFQYFAYSLIYAWAIHLWNKKDMSPCLFFQNLILKFTAFDQFSRNIK